MKRTALMLIVLLGSFGLLSGCDGCPRSDDNGRSGNGTQKKMALSPPKWTPNRPQGMTALTVHGSATEPFTKEDVVEYFKTHNLPKNATTTSDFHVDTLEFITSKEVTARLQGVTTGLADEERLAFVTLSGTFVFTGPAQSKPATFKRAYAVFVASNGNLLLLGSLDSQRPIG